MNRNQHYRQGDVLIRAVSSIPAKSKRRALENGRIILAHGEVTGHAHVVQTDAETVEAFLADLDGQTFLSIPNGGSVVHEEHATITLPPGEYEIVRQREYTPEAIRQVQD